MGTVDIAPSLQITTGTQTQTIETGYKYINGLTGNVNVYSNRANFYISRSNFCS